MDELQELADEFGVKVLPTFKVLSKGREELESFNGTTALLSGGLERKLRRSVRQLQFQARLLSTLPPCISFPTPFSKSFSVGY